MGETIAVTQEKAKEWKADCSWRFPPVAGLWDTCYRTVNVRSSGNYRSREAHGLNKTTTVQPHSHLS